MQTSTRALLALHHGAAAAGHGMGGARPFFHVFGPSVWRGKPGRKAVALTFDDGPSPATPRILDILASYKVPATFFQCGENVLRAPELSQAVCAGPHEIGNHSHTHPNFALKRPSYIVDEFLRGAERHRRGHVAECRSSCVRLTACGGSDFAKCRSAWD